MAEKKIKDVETERFDGHSIIKSKKYKRYADLLWVELEEGVMYSHDEVEAIIQKALARPVIKVINE